MYTAEEAAMLVPAFVRAALDQMLLRAAVAHLAEMAELGADAVQYLWERAARMVLEVRCRTAGDVTTGEKWLPHRARCLGLANSKPITTAAGFAELLIDSGLPNMALSRVVCAVPARGAERIRFVGGELLRGRRDDRARRTFEAVRRAEIDLTVDDDILREVVDERP